MEPLTATNKEIRKKVKLLKTEFAALNSIYCELFESIPNDQQKAILIETGKFLTEEIGEKKVQGYYVRSADRMNAGRLEFDLLRILKETKYTKI